MKKSILCAISVLGLCVACQEEQKAPAGAAPSPAMMQIPSPAVMVDHVIMHGESASTDYNGYVEAINTVDVQPRIAGYLEKLSFEQGAMVYKDSMLAKIEETTYRAKVNMAKARVKQVKAELEFAETNLKRQEQLMQTHAGTQAAYDEAKRLIDLTRGSLEEAQASLVDAENDFSYTRIFSPLTGRIGRVNISEGNYVTGASQPLARIVQVDPIYVRTSLPESDFQRAINRSASDSNMGETHIKMHLADGTLYDASWRVAVIDNKVDAGTGTVTMWLEYKNPNELLKPGGYVTLSFSEQFKVKYPAVPSSAVLNDKNTSYVWVVADSTNIPKRCDVIERERVGDLVLISSGLDGNEVVVTDGLHKVIPGVPVRPTFATPPRAKK